MGEDVQAAPAVVWSMMWSPMPDALLARPIVPVLRAEETADHDPVIAALLESGLTTVEVTHTTPGTLSALPELVRRWGSAIGVGTVTTVD